MNKVLVLGFFAPVAAAIVLASGCGGDSCTSDTAPVRVSGGCSGAIQAGASVTIGVNVCPTSCVSSTVCQAEVFADHIELSPTFRECSTGCPAGCNFAPVPCTFTAPTAPNTYNVQYPDEAGGLGVAHVTVSSSGSTTCTL